MQSKLYHSTKLQGEHTHFPKFLKKLAIHPVNLPCPSWQPFQPVCCNCSLDPCFPVEFDLLMLLLASEDEILAGNAALCLGNCMEVPSAAPSVLKTDIVRVLLKLAGSDSKETGVQLNAGIALGKLCTAEPRSVVVTLSQATQVVITSQKEQGKPSTVGGTHRGTTSCLVCRPLGVPMSYVSRMILQRSLPLV